MSIVQFPFESDQSYTIGNLRDFEQRLSIARQKDSDLSKAWRVPNSTEMKRWHKIREETYPIKLLADHELYPDDSTFHLAPFGNPNIDAEIRTPVENFHLQITIADPVWIIGDQALHNGGYDHRLVMEALNKDGIVHGSASMWRENGKIVSGLPVKSFEEEFQACRQGLVAAFQRKLRKGIVGCRLLIHARGYDFHTMDFTLEEVAKSAVKLIENELVQSAFEVYYIVEERNKYFFAK
jgi:hypothetical protein